MFSLIHDSTFWQSFGHNIYLVIACIIGQVGIAFPPGSAGKCKSNKIKRYAPYFRIFPKYDLSCMYWFDLEHDLS